MKYRSLRDFLHGLEQRGQLRRVVEPVSTRLEMTALADRVLRAQGPALLLSNPVEGSRSYKFPVLLNLFGTPDRVALGMGSESLGELREVGRLLASL
ncbi:MAG: hypothetical protein RLZZ598_1340, partial [Pseudomonadota bacterium]